MKQGKHKNSYGFNAIKGVAIKNKTLIDLYQHEPTKSNNHEKYLAHSLSEEENSLKAYRLQINDTLNSVIPVLKN